MMCIVTLQESENYLLTHLLSEKLRNSCEMQRHLIKMKNLWVKHSSVIRTYSSYPILGVLTCVRNNTGMILKRARERKGERRR